MAYLTEKQAEALARRAAREAMEDLMKKLGVDASDFLEVQKDFAHLRQQRKASEQFGQWTRRILLGIFITSACAAIWTGFLSGLRGSN